MVWPSPLLHSPGGRLTVLCVLIASLALDAGESRAPTAGVAVLCNRCSSPIVIEPVISDSSSDTAASSSQPALNQIVLPPRALAITEGGRKLIFRIPTGNVSVEKTIPSGSLVIIRDPVLTVDLVEAFTEENRVGESVPQNHPLLPNIFDRSSGVLPGYRPPIRLNTQSEPPVVSLPVKLLVDDDEPAVKAVWQARLLRRIAVVNQTLSASCHVQLTPVAFAEWQSDSELSEFEECFEQFARDVDPSPGTLAIGFTSQAVGTDEKRTLGGCAGPLTRHILLREHGPGITESERLEMLLHELGHILGATHVPDANSVMRARLEDRPSRDIQFSIGFDPVNLIILNTFVQELVAGRKEIREFSQSASGTLRFWYAFVERAFPDDTTAVRLAALLPPVQHEQSEREAAPPVATPTEPAAEKTLVAVPSQALSAKIPSESGESAAQPAPAQMGSAENVKTPRPAGESPPGPAAQLAENTQKSVRLPQPRRRFANEIEGASAILQELVAEWTHPRPEDVPKGKPVGDFVTEDLIRRAARIAQRHIWTDEHQQRTAFLLAIGIVVDDSNLLRAQPGIGDIWNRIESREQRRIRMARLSPATVYGRHDWAQHFGVSAALTSLLGAGSARSLGLAKEWKDSQGDSGFSFTDLCADYAGVRFAEAVLGGQIGLGFVARKFTVSDFIPPPQAYEEGISFGRLISEYGGIFGKKSREVMDQIEDAILRLPVYRGNGMK